MSIDARDDRAPVHEGAIIKIMEDYTESRTDVRMLENWVYDLHHDKDDPDGYDVIRKMALALFTGLHIGEWPWSTSE